MSRRKRMLAGLDEEIREHIERQTQINVDRGMPPEEARRAALIEFGNVALVKEDTRAVWTIAWLENLLLDLRLGLRMLRKSPGFTIVAILTLALGIGACTAIFSILYAVSVRPLPYKNPNQLVVLLRMQLITVSFGGRTVTAPMQSPGVPGPDFLYWARQSDVFSAMAAAEPYAASAVANGQKQTLRGLAVTAGFFKALGVQPAQGRFFVAEDEQTGRNQVAVLGPGLGSRGSWASGVKVGGTIELDGKQYEVIGRAPNSFRMAAISPYLGTDSTPDFFVPVTVAQLNKPPAANSLVAGTLTVFGRLKSGVGIARAQAEMTTIAAGLAKQYPATDAGTSVSVASMQSQVGQASRVLLVMLLVGVGFLLLIACVNVAVLLLIREARQQHEIAVRQAIGAGPARIAKQLLSESLFVSLAGGACGVLVAIWMQGALVSLFPPELIPLTAPVSFNWQVLAFALAVSVAAGVLFGLVPALQLSRTEANELLKEGAYSATGGGRRHTMRNAFVVCEVTLAFALLIVCGLTIAGISGEILTNPGYNPQRVLTMHIRLTPATYPSLASREGIYQQMLSRLDRSRRVKYSALEVPTAAGSVVSAEGPVTLPALKSGPMAEVSSVSPDYFRTAQIPLLRGRSFSWSDYVAKPSVTIVNQALAGALWPNQNPLGKHITTSFPAQPCEVVGVVGNAGMAAMGVIKGLPQIYVPQLPPAETLWVQTQGDAKGTMAVVHDMAAGVGPGVQISAPRTMEETLAEGTKPIRYIEDILDFMALMALLLATVGVFAVTAYTVTQRTHEIGVRVALGARPGQVLSAVMREGIRLSLYGIGIGLVLALGLGKVLMHFLRGVGFGSLATYGEVALLLFAVVIAASYIAARRATRIDPIAALRCE